jgi:predicted transglutaminase-like cysteine proteinase
MSILRFTVVLMLALTASTVAAQARSNMPLGYMLLCVEQPEECEGGGDGSVVVTGEVEATLERINSMVNRSITPQRDPGDTDVWTVNASAGDCEDYVLTKRHQLIALGLPASALRIAYVKTRTQEGHAILVVKTNAQDLVLDNLSSTVESLRDSGYRIISMSGPDPLVWS